LRIEKGGELDVLSSAGKAEMVARTGTGGSDLVKTRPEPKPH